MCESLFNFDLVKLIYNFKDFSIPELRSNYVGKPKLTTFPHILGYQFTTFTAMIR